MASASWTEPIARPADDVWALVRDFGNDSWTTVAMTVDGEGQGAVRTVAMPDGAVVERCERLDNQARSLSYSILSGNPFPTADYLGTMEVVAVDDETSELTWSATWEIDEGSDADAVETALARFLRGSARALRRHLDGSD